MFCVVTELSVSQAFPLQPVPASDQWMTVLGLEPGTGVMVATITAVADAVPGVVSCSVKWLVMSTVTVAFFDGSATLCAVTVTAAGDGRICGAM